MRRLLALALALVAAACSAGGTGGTATPTATTCDQLAVEDAFVRVPPGDNTAIYATVRNDGPADVALVAVEADFAKMVELHETKMDDGVMKMAPVEGGEIVVPAGGTALLEPGGLHAMAMQLQTELVAGDTVPVTFEFDNGCSLELEIPVKAIEG